MNLTFRLRPFGQAHLGVMLAAGLPVAVVAGAAGGWLYQNAVLAVPHAVKALALFAGLPGIAIAVTGLRLRCRSRVLLAALGAIAGLAAVTSSWIVALQHARDHDLVWVESETDAFLRRLPSENARDYILHGIGTEKGRRALDGMLSEPPPPERLTETVRARTFTEYAGFRLRHGWPERGHEASGWVVAIAWSLELVSFALVAVWVSKFFARVRVLSCGVHSKPLAPAVTALVRDIDHAALAAAASRESIDEILAVPRCAGSGREGRFDVRRCPEGDLATVSVTIQWKGPLLQRREMVVENAVVDGARADALMRRLDGEGGLRLAEA